MNYTKFEVIVLLDNSFANASDPRVLRTIKALLNNNISCALICFKDQNLPEFEVIENIPVFRQISPLINRPKSLISLRNFESSKIISAFNFKAVFCNDHLMLDLGSRIKQKHPETFLIYDSHEFFQDYQVEFSEKTSLTIKIKSFIWRKIEMFNERRNARKVDCFITINKSFASFFDKIFKPKQSCLSIRNIPEFTVETPLIENYNSSVFEQLEKIKNNNNIIYFGDYFKRLNGLETVFYALKKMPENTSLIIVGNDKSNEYFKQKAVELKISDRLCIISRLPHKYLKSIAVYAKIAVVPTMSYKYRQVYYSLPNKMFDSIKLELPIICSQLPEHVNIVNEFSNGILTNHENWEIASIEIAKAYSQIIDNYQYYKQNSTIANQSLEFMTEYKALITLLKTKLAIS